jgi:hypothetical protein
VGTVLVVVIAVAVGVLVYRLTAGGAEPTSPAEPPLPGTDDEIGAWTSGEGGVTRSALAPTERRTEVPEGYIPVASGAPSWHARLGGAMGLVIAVAIGAIVLALSLWALVSFVSRLFSGAGV